MAALPAQGRTGTRTLKSSLGPTGALPPSRRPDLGLGATSVSCSILFSRGQRLFCFLSCSFPSIWRRHRSYLESQTQRPRPQRWGVTLSQGDHPGFHRLPCHTVKSTGLPTALHSRPASPWSSRVHQFPPPPEHREGKFPFPLFPAPFAQACAPRTGSPLASQQMLN